MTLASREPGAAGGVVQTPVMSDKRGRWIVFAYYYLAALIGLVMMVIGGVKGLNGLVHMAVPETSNEVRYATERYRYEGPEAKPEKLSRAEEARLEEEAKEDARNVALGDLLTGAATAAVGAPVMAWHLRQARRREPEWADVDDAPIASAPPAQPGQPVTPPPA